MNDDVTVRVQVVRLFPDGVHRPRKTKALRPEAGTSEAPRRRRSDEPTRKVINR